MTIAENIATVHRLYEELNKGNVNIIDEIMDPSFAPHGEAMGLDQTSSDRREAMKQGIMWTRDIFPDINVRIEDTISEGDKVVCRLTYRGTQTGAVEDIPATGREVIFTAIAINKLANGKIVERWFNSDELGMMRQMGLIPTATESQPQL